MIKAKVSAGEGGFIQRPDGAAYVTHAGVSEFIRHSQLALICAQLTHELRKVFGKEIAGDDELVADADGE